MINSSARSKTPAAEQYNFIAYGVPVGISTKVEGVLADVAARVEGMFPEGVEETGGDALRFRFEIRRNRRGVWSLYREGEKVTYGDTEKHFFNYFESVLRLTVAEHAESRVFIHAGVVGWKGKAIVIPARSFQGKTTLVRELAKLGALYYSDEYAVLDAEGRVHPFAKKLSVRGILGEYEQLDLPVEHFGGTAGTGPIPVGTVLITEYARGARWNPVRLSDGLGVLEMLSHTIPIRYNPEFSLKVLNKTARHAIILKTKRGDAARFAKKLLGFLDSQNS